MGSPSPWLISSVTLCRGSLYLVSLYLLSILFVEAVLSDFWDTAGQERFNSLHPSYYHQAHACVLAILPLSNCALIRDSSCQNVQLHGVTQVFDVTRKVTYKNLSRWYSELRASRPEIPCLCAANKIDVARSIRAVTLGTNCAVNLEVTKRSFQFPEKYNIPLYYVSASDGTNVVKVSLSSSLPTPLLSDDQRHQRLSTSLSFVNECVYIYTPDVLQYMWWYQMFRDAIEKAVEYKKNPTDFVDEVYGELELVTSIGNTHSL
ncbi:RABL2B [Cordylochernes scorpioides]|uniref:RABL2B n=1 Tax=Cordylochernes scorpioides TaxID=51811 RepID=A0ABY6KIK6_9ARAC|nr:RABL2B [Cordylochernes scorpioides]